MMGVRGKVGVREEAKEEMGLDLVEEEKDCLKRRKSVCG